MSDAERLNITEAQVAERDQLWHTDACDVACFIMDQSITKDFGGDVADERALWVHKDSDGTFFEYMLRRTQADPQAPVKFELHRSPHGSGVRESGFSFEIDDLAAAYYIPVTGEVSEMTRLTGPDADREHAAQLTRFLMTANPVHWEDLFLSMGYEIDTERQWAQKSTEEGRQRRAYLDGIVDKELRENNIAYAKLPPDQDEEMQKREMSEYIMAIYGLEEFEARVVFSTAQEYLVRQLIYGAY